MDLELALIVVLIGGYALVAAALDRRSIGPAIVFVAIGLLLSGLGVIDSDHRRGAGQPRRAPGCPPVVGPSRGGRHPVAKRSDTP